ncbi:MAG TPA: DNA polymerase ligase N-terminal domain-containing protein [Acidimicrobiales bacterium]|nr:DNA polymerase ligase N-terminal domain-containing protein [Acidimicrobiales bacterium]
MARTAPTGQQPQDGTALTEYRRKRDFTRTPEPAGAGEGGSPDTRPAPAAPGRHASSGTHKAAGRFVVQRHRARRLHYDFRLEIGGVLASWAVPKGPTLDPTVRRAAFHVEDHPLEYFNFEGVIPKGEYGGGDVIVWDEGTWDLHATSGPSGPAEALAAGELHLDVHGQKLHGRFLLVRGKRSQGDGKDQWLLLHKHDEYAVEGWDPEDHPRSVLSGRTNDEVKQAPDRMWRSGLPAAQAEVDLRSASAAAEADEPARTWLPASGAELGQLEQMGVEGKWLIFGRELKVTNLDKVLFPAREGEGPVTKRDLLRYSAQVAPVILPYLAGRALNMHRYPNGADSKGFWHKELPDHAPDWAPRWENKEADRGETRTYLVVDEPAALIWAANFGALEWHAWTSKIDHPHLPTYALIDLDPGPKTTWDDLLVLARLHRTALEHLGVRGWPKVTGQRGVQIWVPVKRGLSFDETRLWTEQLSRAVGAVVPELVSWKWTVSDRSGLARLDYTQNAINKTLVAPYSPRPASGAPVSAPIEWDELDDPSLTPDKFTVRTIIDRLATKGDLFGGVLSAPQNLPSFG